MSAGRLGLSEQTTAEVLAVVAGAFALLAILAIFGLAGRFGELVRTVLIDSFGLAGFLLPFALAGVAIVFFKSAKTWFRPASVVGTLLLFLTVPGLFFQNGGSVGQMVSQLAISVFGPIGAFTILIALTLISLLLATNISLRNFQQIFKGSDSPRVTGQDQAARVSVFETLRRIGGSQAPEAGPAKTLKQPVAKPTDSSWTLPPIELLDLSQGKAQPGNIERNVAVIQKTLKDFGIEVTMGDVSIGPTVTQYALKPAEGVKLTAITARTNDLALALAAHPIRIEAPIPGKSAVGIEVPNKQVATVSLRDVLESGEFQAIKSNLSLGLGRDVAGAPVAIDLTRMPHILIAGSTGSGKSVALNGILVSLLYQNSPNQLKILLIDPKRVEFTHYNSVPHLLTPVVTEINQTVNALRWTINQMDQRFRLFQQTGHRDLAGYNSRPDEAGPLPYIVVVIDELADLMAQASSEVEGAIVRLAQLARATGIHLVVATQRPSVDVITGLIKANISARIAFAVASQFDSRTILDSAGAERLLGSGDMLYVSPELSKPRRVQGVLVKDKEIKAVTEFLKNQAQPDYDDSIVQYRGGQARGLGQEGAIDDELFEQAQETVIAAGRASASLLQRRLRVGYARAARLLDLLEDQGIIGPADGAKPRDILDGNYPKNESI